jgi:hypothetical protein
MSFSKEIWGNNIWYLFHGIARKINENKFKQNKEDMIFILKNICNTLPCPECSRDATALINKVNFDYINNKNDFELLIFNFHNSVNKKLNKPLFDFKEINNKYNNINIDALFNNFYIIYTSNTNIPQLMNTSFHRQNIFPKIKKSLLKIRPDLL